MALKLYMDFSEITKCLSNAEKGFKFQFNFSKRRSSRSDGVVFKLLDFNPGRQSVDHLIGYKISL